MAEPRSGGEPDAIIRKDRRNLAARIKRQWYLSGEQKDEILVLRLRSGQTGVLVAPGAIRGRAIAVYALDDPAATLAAFTELTGIDVEAPT
jgi:hypothetical protein